MNQAYLPPDLYENTIENMAPGQSGYTVPWAMHVDYSGALWLNAKYTLTDTPFGTSNMKVSRRKDGYVVEVRDHSYLYSPGAEYVGGNNSVPVVELIR